ncbi:MAG: hypothetical protein N2037_03630 [Acidimicrobiales bacterium]|nr:hypothetical protein [Acidimicrobiales bacterium]
MNFKRAIAAGALSSTLLVGGVSVASAETQPPVRDPQAVCDHLDEIKAAVQRANERYQQLVAKIQAVRQRAADAGRDDLVARLDQLLNRLTSRHDRVSARVQAFLARADRFCATAP